MKPKNAKHDTLCWECENQCGGCAWSREFKPVEGWKAIPTKVKAEHYGNGRCIDSFDVRECPEFVPIERKKKPNKKKGKKDDSNIRNFLKDCGILQKELANKSGLCDTTMSRWVTGGVVSENTVKRIADALGVTLEELNDKCMKGGKV